MTVSGARSVPIIDLGKEYRSLKKEIDAAVGEVLASGSYILGSQTERFEKELAAYCAASHAVGVNSGTDALLIALRSLDVGPGDEVLLPAMSFIATAEPVVQLKATPVFVDIDPLSLTIDPGLAAKKISAKTKAIIAVHLYGQCADMQALTALSRERNIPLIEDMAQAIGAEFEGKKAGGFGTLACLSFFPTKNLGACGDGGAVVTSSNVLAERLRRLRNHGAQVKYHHEEIGYNTRLDELQAAILRVKLRRLDEWNDERRAHARKYHRLLAGAALTLPEEIPGRKHVYHLYSVQTPRRDELKAFLEKRRIAAGLHYPSPLHLQPALRFLGHREGDFPNSERLARRTLSLPLYAQMTDEDLRSVAGAVRDYLDGVEPDGKASP